MARGFEGSGVRARDNNIEIRFVYRNERFAERLDLRPTTANLKFAKAQREKINKEIELGVFDYARWFPNSRRIKQLGLEPDQPQVVTFREMGQRWLATIRQEKEKGTVVKYEGDLNFYWYPTFGDADVRTLRASVVAERVGQAADWSKKSAKTRNNALISLRGVFDFCIADQLITENPARLLKNRKKKPRKPSPLELEEVDLILKHMRKNYHEQIANYYEFAFFTGLRSPEEMIAVCWGDVDMPGKLARIERAMSYGEEKGTKTGEDRDVELNYHALQALQRQKKWSFMAGDRADGRIFLNPATGKPWPRGNQLHASYWTPTLRALGLRYRNPYQTRHTYATMEIMAGANIACGSPNSSATQSPCAAPSTFTGSRKPRAPRKARS
jgi:integrase